MDGDTFDALVQRALGTSSRRGMLRAGFGALAASALATLSLNAADEAQAKKKKKKGQGKKKKKNKKKLPPPGNVCLTVGGMTTCQSASVCCDPQKSTGGGCAPLGFPVCCLSDMFAHPAGTSCCDSPLSGNFGVCEHPGYPHCCPPSLSGCCEAGFPVCCNDTVNGGGYCCLAGDICCPETESGCCTAQGTGLTAERAESAPRGTRRTTSSRPSAGLPRFEPVD